MERFFGITRVLMPDAGQFSFLLSFLLLYFFQKEVLSVALTACTRSHRAHIVTFPGLVTGVFSELVACAFHNSGLYNLR